MQCSSTRLYREGEALLQPLTDTLLLVSCKRALLREMSTLRFDLLSSFTFSPHLISLYTSSSMSERTRLPRKAASTATYVYDNPSDEEEQVNESGTDEDEVGSKRTKGKGKGALSLSCTLSTRR